MPYVSTSCMVLVYFFHIAEAGDYTPVNNQMFMFSSGGSMTVTVATLPDTAVEGSETLLLQIVGVSALATTCTTTPSVTLTILDDDSKIATSPFS